MNAKSEAVRAAMKKAQPNTQSSLSRVRPMAVLSALPHAV